MTAEREGIADYQFIRCLGAGSHGVFYLARRPERLPVSAEYVAVKVLAGGSSQDVFRRAARELTAFAAVSSPHLVSLYDAGQQGDELYYSMEYLPGGSLASPAGQLDTATVLTAVADAARAAHALHEAGMAHSAIKPGNVLLAPPRGKLADLGLSQVISPGLTITRMGPANDIEYLDPGLIRGDRPSRASDIFSLGATLHSALAGRGLYGSLPEGDPLLTLRRMQSRPPSISASLDPAAIEVIAWAIADKPADRPATAVQLAERIEQLVAAQTPSAQELPGAEVRGPGRLLGQRRAAAGPEDGASGH